MRVRIFQKFGCEVRKNIGGIGHALGESYMGMGVCPYFQTEIRAPPPIIMLPNGSFGNNCYLCKK